ncbi:non-specific lipid transfer protein GPI-anchored 31-like [Populus nigra]|uniref:non-specific lipid transfer protein GPI-anchored 31-like n=1 Tax=Populus nigra TaxID=3691 RepID=UPI002B2687A3|nr:non-specific lipid transfer protein GPI-anchored 31-like [Populus nigra]
MKTALFITCILATLAVLANSAQHGSPPKSPAPAPSVDCSDVAFDMLDCVTYLSDGNAEKPTDSCCAGFEAVLSLDDDQCLCFALKHSADFAGVAVNLTRAAALSSECGVSAPPLSRCGISVPPSGAPEPAAPSPVLENDQPSAPAPAPSNSDDNGRSAAAPATSDVPAQAPAKGTACAVSAPSSVLISSAVASALSLFLWI